MKEIETERMRLRYLRKEDAPLIFDGWATDSEVAKYLTWSPHKDISETEEILASWLDEYKKHECIRYGIESKENNELMGMIDVVGYFEGNPVIGYCLARKYWNKGYMSEAFKAVIDMLFESGFKRIFIEAVKENIGSIRVIEKNGFVFLGYKYFPLSPEKPEIVTVCAYRLDKRRYKKINRKVTVKKKSNEKIYNKIKTLLRF